MHLLLHAYICACTRGGRCCCCCCFFAAIQAKSSQSARKAASLRAKFERWESEVEHNNEYNRNERNEDDEECMPSIDTARNLRAMFENKAQEASRPVVSSQPKLKVNRFVVSANIWFYFMFFKDSKKETQTSFYYWCFHTGDVSFYEHIM